MCHRYQAISIFKAKLTWFFLSKARHNTHKAYSKVCDYIVHHKHALKLFEYHSLAPCMDESIFCMIQYTVYTITFGLYGVYGAKTMRPLGLNTSGTLRQRFRRIGNRRFAGHSKSLFLKAYEELEVAGSSLSSLATDVGFEVLEDATPIPDSHDFVKIRNKELWWTISRYLIRTIIFTSLSLSYILFVF